MDIAAREIYNKAIELGFADCGIVKAKDMLGYRERLERRTERFPETRPYYSYFDKFACPQGAEPFAKAIVVCVGRYGRYAIPAHLRGRIGKLYLTDYRTVPESKEYRAAAALDRYLSERGVRFKRDIHGISAGRYAAAWAGLGIVRKNNFFYTEHGSWVWVETWLIDRELELIRDVSLPPCPKECTRCIDACATHALAEPFQTNAFRCTSMLTWGGLPGTLPPEDIRMDMKGWLYGCDDCQDCCPMNAGCWSGDEDFSRMKDIAKVVTLEQLLSMDEDAVIEKLSPLFWYIGRHNAWKWKTQALRAMAYERRPEYLPYIVKARGDSNELVREMAQWAYCVVQENQAKYNAPLPQNS